MFIYQLLKEYKQQFGFKNTFLRNVKINGWIILYLLTSICFPVIIFLLFYSKEIMWMALSIIIYFLVLYIGGEQHKRKMIKFKPANSLAYNVRPFRKMLHDTFSITTDDQLLRLDEIIKREIAMVEYNRKYPLSDIIRQLIVAILVTGLLSYAFFEIKDGNMEKATPLLDLYLLFIGLTFMVGGVLKQIREFGASSHLNDISFLIQLSLLDNSINSNREEFHEHINIIQIPSRKEKHK